MGLAKSIVVGFNSILSGTAPWHDIANIMRKPPTMKPIFLMYLTLVIVSMLIFAIVYSLFKDVVESHPETFSIGLGMLLLTGVYGMLDNIISNTTHDKLPKYE